jgi:predicted hydrocarbon binding protein
VGVLARRFALVVGQSRIRLPRGEGHRRIARAQADVTGEGEKLNDTATVKGTMLRAHLSWAAERLGPPATSLAPRLSPADAALVTEPILPTDWIPLRSLVSIDRAIAAGAGGAPESVFLELGRASARVNLGGAYRSFVSSEPHRFFEKSSLLHDRFQNFGRSAYQKTGERSGRMRMEDYPVFSPVFCATGRGYFEEALRLMHVPGPVVVEETECLCAGSGACVFEMSW